MKSAIICCSVLKHETQKAVKACPGEFDLCLLDTKLHNSPAVLNQKLQETIDSLKDYEIVYLTYGNCGDSTLGITAKHCPIRFPITDDCINCLLYYDSELRDLRKHSYFSSIGWESWNDGTEKNRLIERYGEKKGMRIFKAMYRNYHDLVYIKTDADDGSLLAQSRAFAEEVDLTFHERTGSYKLLTDLFSGVQDERFHTLQIGQSITKDVFRR